MKKYLYILIIAVLGVFISCSGDDDKTVYTVTFETDGGTPIPSTQQIEAGSVATAPSANPAKIGYTFVFWHISGSTTAYNFQTPVNNNITLYAKWQEESTAEYWQVTWSLNGGSWPSDDNHATQVLKGGTLAEPAAPIKSGSIFEGWYKESELTNKVIFPYNTNSITGNFALYAKWKTESGGETNAFTIRNTTDWSSAINTIKTGGSGLSYTLTIEGNVSVPPTTGVEQGKPATYTFGGGHDITVTLKGNGTLALSSQGFLMCLSGTTLTGETVVARQKLVIDGPTLQGRSDNAVQLLRLDYADLELKSGKITGNTNNHTGGGSGNGGGMLIRYGSLIMTGGEISNNTDAMSGKGGGINLTYSTFTMSGGTISGNMAANGGGVYFYGGTHIDRRSEFSMTGGVIKGNTARSSSPWGGGVYITQYSVFNKTGGVIYGSDAEDANRNKVIYNTGDNAAADQHGIAIYYIRDGVLSTYKTKFRDATLDESDDITTENTTGWGI